MRVPDYDVLVFTSGMLALRTESSGTSGHLERATGRLALALLAAYNLDDDPVFGHLFRDLAQTGDLAIARRRAGRARQEAAATESVAIRVAFALLYAPPTHRDVVRGVLDALVASGRRYPEDVAPLAAQFAIDPEMQRAWSEGTWNVDWYRMALFRFAEPKVQATACLAAVVLQRDDLFEDADRRLFDDLLEPVHAWLRTGEQVTPLSLASYERAEAMRRRCYDLERARSAEAERWGHAAWALEAARKLYRFAEDGRVNLSHLSARSFEETVAAIKGAVPAPSVAEAMVRARRTGIQLPWYEIASTAESDAWPGESSRSLPRSRR